MSKHSNPTFEALHTFHVDIPARRVFLCSAMADSNANPEDGEPVGMTDYVVRNLLWLDNYGQGNVELWINTEGGDTTEMWAIHDVMRTMGHKVDTVAYGQVCSAGCLLLAAGTGTRYAMMNAAFMWHGAEENPDAAGSRELRRGVEWSTREEQRWLHHMGLYTRPPTRAKRPQTPAQRARFWERYIHDNALWLDAQGMVDHGVVDQVWEGR